MERMTQEAMRTAFSVGRSAKDRIARWLCALCVASILCAPSLAQTGGDVIGEHDLSPGSSSPLQGALSGSCIYCHAPHSGLGGINQSALWDQKLSKVTNYTPYTSSTMINTTMQPLLGADSSLCLSCHDGTVAPGQLVPYGQITMSGTPMQAPD